MSSWYSISIDGADELKKNMEEMIHQCPDQLNLAMKRAAKGFREDCNDKFPTYYEDGKRPFPKEWKTDNTYGDLGIITVTEVKNKAPHFHLVENGHRKFINGVDTGGFVKGKHYAAKTRAEYEDKYPEILDQAVNQALKEADL